MDSRSWRATTVVTRTETVRIARRILDERPDCVVRLRLLRDVLRLHPADDELQAAKREVSRSPQVALLAKEQRADGSWGRLHSADSSARQKVGTTEAGVARALSLGLVSDDAILHDAAGYLASVVSGHGRVADLPERNDRWAVGVNLFAGSMLSLIEPQSPVLDEVWQRWAEIVCRVFARGEFNAGEEVKAQEETHAVRDGVRYLALNNRYTVILMGARPSRLPKNIREAYVRWLRGLPCGLGYVGVRCWPPPEHAIGREISGWLLTIRLLERLDVPASDLRRCVEWLWEKRAKDGLWGFGPEARELRLSPTWRRPEVRSHDHSVLPLVLTTHLLERGSDHD